MVNRISKLASTVNYEVFWPFRDMGLNFWETVFYLFSKVYKDLLG